MKLIIFVVEEGLYKKEDIYTAKEATETDLSIVHSTSYLDSLKVNHFLENLK